jgi:hypothetical protein
MQHYKTQGHQFWNRIKNKKNTIIKINRLEIESTVGALEHLRAKNGHLRRLNILLLERISDLKLN